MIWQWLESTTGQIVAYSAIIGVCILAMALMGCCKLNGDADQYLEDHEGVRRS